MESNIRLEHDRSLDGEALVRTSRAEGKRLTRDRLLAAAHRLLEDQSFDAISLRLLTREAGVSPGAFYRHFEDMDALGLVLVDESFAALHESIRLARADAELGLSAASSAGIVFGYAAENRDRFRFLARERCGGSAPLRAAIAGELSVFERELSVDLMRDPVVSRWPSADVQMLAGLLVTLMTAAIDDLLEAPGERAQAEVAERVQRRLELLAVGIAGWNARHPLAEAVRESPE